MIKEQVMYDNSQRVAMDRATRLQLNKRFDNLTTYWPKPGNAITVMASILDDFGFVIRDIISFNDSQQDYQNNYSLTFGEKEINHFLVFSWHKIESGRFEVLGYIS